MPLPLLLAPLALGAKALPFLAKGAMAGAKALPGLAGKAGGAMQTAGKGVEAAGSKVWNAGAAQAGKLPGIAETGASKLWNLGAEGATKLANYKGIDGGSMMPSRAQGNTPPMFPEGGSSFNPGLSETTGREMPADLARVAEQQRASSGGGSLRDVMMAHAKKRLLERAMGGGGGGRDAYAQPAPPAMELPDYATGYMMGSVPAAPQPSLSQYIGQGGY